MVYFRLGLEQTKHMITLVRCGERSLNTILYATPMVCDLMILKDRFEATKFWREASYYCGRCYTQFPTFEALNEHIIKGCDKL